MWQTCHSFLSQGKGDIEDHSTLLCNLLLGFGLDAFVAIGISINGPHTWVITRNKLENKQISIIFWESLTAQRINLADPKVFRFYKKIHCVFNDKKFFGNIQVDDTVFNTIYNFEDEFLWKRVPYDKIDSLPKYTNFPFIDIIPINLMEIENNIEKEIKSKITKYRKSKKKI
jgi:centrosomal protein CEP76